HVVPAARRSAPLTTATLATRTAGGTGNHSSSAAVPARRTGTIVAVYSRFSTASAGIDAVGATRSRTRTTFDGSLIRNPNGVTFPSESPARYAAKAGPMRR